MKMISKNDLREKGNRKSDAKVTDFLIEILEKGDFSSHFYFEN